MSPLRVEGLLAKVATTLGVVGSGEGMGPSDLCNCRLLRCTVSAHTHTHTHTKTHTHTHTHNTLASQVCFLLLFLTLNT